MDIELAVTAMEMAQHIDQMVLFSGDGDFRSLVEAVQRKGVRVSVVSTVATQPPMVADELRRQADEFVDLTQLDGAHRPRSQRAGGARLGDPRRQAAKARPRRRQQPRTRPARVSASFEPRQIARERRCLLTSARPRIAAPARGWRAFRDANRAAYPRLAQRAGRIVRRSRRRGC